jgi:hypothetical protein
MRTRTLPDAMVLPRLREMAIRLRDLGLHEAEAQVRRAIEQAPSDPEGAADLLGQTAILLASLAPEARRSD